MRFCILLSLLISGAAVAELLHASPVERPTDATSTAADLIVKLGTNSIVHFYLSGERATSQLAQAVVHRQVDANAGFTSPLCYPDVGARAAQFNR